ncbi:processed acidic surface protein [Peribacillus alkalitolerans]|uniref:processed acidic surface protein n=1 Tax=Peribacillus alkalitolerans TaxID=1550385 RepID=UPI0013D21E40|nr:processed acidic surface protein [Peribacillus alkalitolerans]
MKRTFAIIIASLLVFLFNLSAFAAVNEVELTEYVESIPMTVEELEEYLAAYGLSTEDFESTEELIEFLGEPLTEDSLNTLLIDYDMTYDELRALLVEYGEIEESDKIEDHFHFVSDVEEFILIEQGFGEIDEDMFSDMEDIFSEMGMTEEELTRLFEHIGKVIEADPTIFEQMDALSEQMVGLEDFETATELTPDQIAELMSIFDQINALLQLDFQFYLEKDGVKTPISMAALMEIQDPNGASLFVEIYDTNGNLLLDALFTPDMLGSEIITETGEQIQNVTAQVAQVQKSAKTVKGAKMPETAGNYSITLMFGLALMAAAGLLVRRAKAIK